MNFVKFIDNINLNDTNNYGFNNVVCIDTIYLKSSNIMKSTNDYIKALADSEFYNIGDGTNNSSNTNESGNNSSNTNGSGNNSSNGNDSINNSVTEELKKRVGALISITTDKSSYKAGETVTIKIRITNAGEGDLSMVRIAMSLPEGFELIDTETGITKNIYERSIWFVDNLRVESNKYQEDGNGSKTMTIRAIAGKDMDSRDITLMAYYLSVRDSNYGDILHLTSPAYTSFKITSVSDSEANNQKNNPREGSNATIKGANSTNDGRDHFEARNILGIAGSGSGFLDGFRGALFDSGDIDMGNNSTGINYLDSLESSNPSSQEPMYEVKDLSGDKGGSISSQELGFLIAAIVLLIIVAAGYFYEIRRRNF